MDYERAYTGGRIMTNILICMFSRLHENNLQTFLISFPILISYLVWGKYKERKIKIQSNNSVL